MRTPRDRDGSFEPRIVAKRQTCLTGLDEKILGLYAGGMSVRDISGHLSELYDTEIGRDTISRITDAVLEDVVAWRSRPLDAVYPIVYFDSDVREGPRRPLGQEPRLLPRARRHLRRECEVLGIWWQETEGSKFWLSVLNDLQRRGVQDVLVACVDGLKGFPDAIEAVFLQAWVQPCERETPVSRWYGVRYWTVRSILRPTRPPER